LAVLSPSGDCLLQSPILALGREGKDAVWVLRYGSLVDLVRRLIKELSAVHEIAGWGCLFEYSTKLLLNLPGILKARTLAPVDCTMGGKTRNFTFCGSQIRLDGRLFAGAREIYGRKIYFALPGFSLKPGDVVIDLGANAGVFTTLAALVAAKVVAVEAQSEFTGEIRSNAARNGCSHKVSIEFAILGAGSGYFSDPERLKAGSHFSEMPPAISMGELLDRHQIRIVNFLKVDIEGSEFDLFSGDLEWLSRVEKIAMEVHLEFGKVDHLVEVLEKHGFHVRLLDNDQHMVNRIGGNCGYLFASRAGFDRIH